MFRPSLGVASRGHGAGRGCCPTFAVEQAWVCAWHWVGHGGVPGIVLFRECFPQGRWERGRSGTCWGLELGSGAALGSPASVQEEPTGKRRKDKNGRAFAPPALPPHRAQAPPASSEEFVNQMGPLSSAEMSRWGLEERRKTQKGEE